MQGANKKDPANRKLLASSEISAKDPPKLNEAN